MADLTAAFAAVFPRALAWGLGLGYGLYLAYLLVALTCAAVDLLNQATRFVLRPHPTNRGNLKPTPTPAPYRGTPNPAAERSATCP
ncbi:MAG: hypothetical protein AAF612_10345 [Planctomycetota bacterium]